MNALARHALRQSSFVPDELTTLTPDTCRILPSGNRIPLLGLGTRELTFHTVETICNALTLGFRMIDTAPDYHTQRGIGDAIRACGLERAARSVMAASGRMSQPNSCSNCFSCSTTQINKSVSV